MRKTEQNLAEANKTDFGQTMGQRICTLRKQQGLTQKQLAEQMNVTDKAVSKWERDLACPDIASIPQLANILEISVEELLQAEQKPTAKKQEIRTLRRLIYKAVALAMGVALVVLGAFLKQMDLYSAVTITGIGLCCVVLYLFEEER